VTGLNQTMSSFIYPCRLLFRWIAPKQKYHFAFFFFVQYSYHFIGKVFPSLLGMTVGFSLSDRQDGVQQQDSLLGPMFEIAMVLFYGKIVNRFRNYVFKRWRDCNKTNEDKFISWNGRILDERIAALGDNILLTLDIFLN
jgi:hypothetical protein